MAPAHELTDHEEKALAIFDLYGGRAITCTEMGEELFRDSPGRRNRQCYARPGGKVLHALERKGRAYQTEVQLSDGSWRHAWQRTGAPAKAGG